MLRHEIVADLKKRIARGYFAPGERLTEIKLCGMYNVGRSRIREALRQLEQEGFLRIILHAGAVVTQLSQKDIEQIYDLMGVLEGLSIRAATPFIDKKEIGKIKILLKKMETTKNPYRFFYYNWKFHDFLTTISANDSLIKFIGNLRAQANRIGLRSFYNPGQIKASIAEHRKIFEAIEEKKPMKVEKLVRNHYLNAKQRLIRFINKSL